MLLVMGRNRACRERDGMRCIVSDFESRPIPRLAMTVQPAFWNWTNEKSPVRHVQMFGRSMTLSRNRSVLQLNSKDGDIPIAGLCMSQSASHDNLHGMTGGSRVLVVSHWPRLVESSCQSIMQYPGRPNGMHQTYAGASRWPRHRTFDRHVIWSDDVAARSNAANDANKLLTLHRVGLVYSVCILPWSPHPPCPAIGLRGISGEVDNIQGSPD